jgi:hypothetical protein
MVQIKSVIKSIKIISIVYNKSDGLKLKLGGSYRKFTVINLLCKIVCGANFSVQVSHV